MKYICVADGHIVTGSEIEKCYNLKVVIHGYKKSLNEFLEYELKKGYLVPLEE